MKRIYLYVAIVFLAILSAGLALWSYRNKVPQVNVDTQRSTISAAFPNISACQQIVENSFAKKIDAKRSAGPRFACDLGISKGLPISEAIRSVSIGDNGVIVVKFHPDQIFGMTESTNTLTFVPLLSSGTAPRTEDDSVKIARWRCGILSDGTTVQAQFFPQGCGR